MGAQFSAQDCYSPVIPYLHVLPLSSSVAAKTMFTQNYTPKSLMSNQHIINTEMN